MNHQHLPALNRYTSPNQYEALKEIKESKSIINLLMKTYVSKTLGSLMRAAWISAVRYTDSEGVIREGWDVTEAGQHAMRMFELKLEEKRKDEERLVVYREQRSVARKALFNEALVYYRLIRVRKAYEAKVAEIQTQCRKLEGKCNMLGADFSQGEAKMVFEAAAYQVDNELEPQLSQGDVQTQTL